MHDNKTTRCEPKATPSTRHDLCGSQGLWLQPPVATARAAPAAVSAPPIPGACVTRAATCAELPSAAFCACRAAFSAALSLVVRALPHTLAKNDACPRTPDVPEDDKHS